MSIRSFTSWKGKIKVKRWDKVLWGELFVTLHYCPRTVLMSVWEPEQLRAEYWVWIKGDNSAPPNMCSEVTNLYGDEWVHSRPRLLFSGYVIQRVAAKIQNPCSSKQRVIERRTELTILAWIFQLTVRKILRLLPMVLLISEFCRSWFPPQRAFHILVC